MRVRLINILKVGCLASACFLLLWSSMYTSDSSDEHVEAIDSSRIQNNLQIMRRRNAPNNTTRNLLLFAYMRSGSTALGQLLQNSSGVFFMFEPLSPLASYSYFTDKAVCKMRDDTCKTEGAREKIVEAVITTVNLFSCNLRSVSTPVLDKMATEGKSGIAWKQYGSCVSEVRNQTRDQHFSESDEGLQKCLRQLEDACMSADMRVAKVLRLGFSTIKTILDTTPDLKILYLARDPRAIINSRIKTVWFPVPRDKPTIVHDNILSLCKKMKADISMWNTTMHGKYGDRILHTTLNKLASGLRPMFDMFKFMNKPVTLTDETNILNSLCKSRNLNITEMWKDELLPAYRTFTEGHCGSIIKHIDEVES